MYAYFFKRVIDIVLSFFLLILLSPIIVVISILIRKKLGSPILFVAERPGLKGKRFKLYKFRSMSDERDENGELLLDSIRLTKFGRKLRATSLDELPSLLNVLKGDMSLVGPRPLSVKYLPYYTEEVMKRHNVRPGITGLAQVNGRNSITWEERFEYDLKYVNNVSLFMDISIIYQTIMVVLKKEDIGERVDKLADFHEYRKQKLNSTDNTIE